jgi:hypothetical protein
MREGFQMGKTNWIDTHIAELTKLQAKLDTLPEQMRIERIEVLSDMLVYIGKLAAEFSEEYKGVYAERKRVYAQAEIDAPKKAQAHAELAVIDLREQEKEAYGNMKRWANAFDSTKEKINALKYRIKIDIEDGSSRRGS